MTDYRSVPQEEVSMTEMGVTKSTDKEIKRKENRTDTENLDFEIAENKLHEKKLANTTKKEFEHETRIKWVIAFFIAVITGGIAVAANTAIRGLHSIKFDTVNHFIDQDDYASPIIIFTTFNVCYTLVATLLVSVLEPKAKGSGIPEIKSVLNGRRIHRVIALRTMISKVVGIIFAVGAGAFVGKEGPMIHTGAIVGALTAQGRPEILKYNLPWLSYFRNDVDASEFIGMGAAAGVAAAFGAPIGGVLFVIEEAATFWSSPLTWRSFFCTMTATLIVYWVRDMGSNTWSMSESGLVSFGSFEGASKDSSYPSEVPYTLYEVFIFLLMGILGGLMGALFNDLNQRLSKLRRKYVLIKRRKIFEALFVIALTSVVIFVSGWLTSCQTLPPEDQQNLELEQFSVKKDNGMIWRR